jgi:hypothetical protein
MLLVKTSATQTLPRWGASLIADRISEDVPG